MQEKLLKIICDPDRTDYVVESTTKGVPALPDEHSLSLSEILPALLPTELSVLLSL
jgi:hypothetical protein